jgi:hypothetical protein
MESDWERPVPGEASDTEILYRLGYAHAIDEIVSRLSELKLVGMSRLASFARNTLLAYGFGLDDCSQFLTWF